MKRYAIWNKKDQIITPIGEVLSADQWIARYPVAGVASITIVCSAGEINGAFFGTLGSMRQTYENMGADFSACQTDEDVLNVIEDFEDALNAPTETTEPTVEERTATALETIASGAGKETTSALDALLGEDE